jgi:hypothetical protein
MASSAANDNDDDDDWLEDDSPGFGKAVGGHGSSSSSSSGIAGELGIKNEGYRIGKERITQKMIQVGELAIVSKMHNCVCLFTCINFPSFLSL